ncbi:MAG: gliding motility-associated C-terminal domain-containing protein [Bacteroidales bacterium]|nr:gliding motility-associated C-terminal domain-containing protein [Bacteroidales bacterium]
MPETGVIERSFCMSEAYVLRALTMDSSRLGTHVDAAVRLVSNENIPIHATVTADLCDATSSIYVYDGVDINGTLLATINSGNSMWSPFSYTAQSGSIYIRYVTEGTDSCFEDFHASISSGPYEISASDVKGVSAVIDWLDQMPPRQWTILYGTNKNNLDKVVHARSHPYTLRGLEELTDYYIRVLPSDTTEYSNSCAPAHIRTRCHYEQQGCINYTNIKNDCRVECSYGAYGSPTQHYGTLDYGENSDRSRHTVCHTRQIDPRATTNRDTLWTIPECEVASVRLGNPVREGQSERINYYYYVDTRYYDLLIMKYAVVLENPSHGISAQPRFDFEITDEQGTAINPSCNSATFIPNYYGTGSWKNGKSGAKWQDWTTIGLDLTPLNGRIIKVTLTSKDCVYAGHWGYAYFILKCANRNISSLHCGADIANTFHAPEGFSYEWFNTDNPSTILSRADTLYVDRIGTYACRMAFHGQDASATCEFTSTAVAGPRYPVAIFDTVCTDTIGCYFRFSMTNNSRIAEDEGHNFMTEFPCESYEWIVDDSIRFYTTDLTYDFLFGHHKVQLVAKLSGGLCSDTLTVPIYRGPICFIYDTILYTPCDSGSASLFDTVMYNDGMWTRDSADHIHTLIYRTRYSTTEIYPDTVTENDLPSFRFNDASFTKSTDTLFMLKNVVDCDSFLTYKLLVCWNFDTLLERIECDNVLPLRWEDGYFEQADTQMFQYLRYCRGDSNVILSLGINPTYLNDFYDTICDNEYSIMSDHAYHTAGVHSLFFRTIEDCDSVERLFLEVRPTYHTLDNRVICSYDSVLWLDSVVYRVNTHTPFITVRSIDNCDSNVHLDLVVQAPVEAVIGCYPNSASYSHPEVTLYDYSHRSDSRVWYLPDGTVTGMSAPSFIYPVGQDSVDVMMIAIDTLGCVDTAHRVIYMERASVWVPNVITAELPTNNVFFVRGLDILDFEIYIYNRMGHLVFHSKDVNEAWDGTYHGSKCPQAAYTYVINYTSVYNPKSWLKKVGTVLLLR